MAEPYSSPDHDVTKDGRALQLTRPLCDQRYAVQVPGMASGGRGRSSDRPANEKESRRIRATSAQSTGVERLGNIWSDWYARRDQHVYTNRALYDRTALCP
eukprot:3619578-Pyramimonas_sp.AAC.1